MIVLWAAAVYFATNYANKNKCWIAAVPATFMSAVSVTYLMYAPECFNLIKQGQTGIVISYAVGVVVAVIFLAIFLVTAYIHPAKSLERQKKIILERKQHA